MFKTNDSFLKIIEEIRRDIDNDMEATTNYDFALTTENATGQSIKILKTHKDTGKTTSSTIIPLGFYEPKKKIFKWSFQDIYYDKIISQLSMSDLPINQIEKILKPLFANEIKITQQKHDLLPIMYASFNPMFHLIKFTTYDKSNKLIFYALVTLPKKSSLSDIKFQKILEYFEEVISLQNLMKKIKKQEKSEKPKKKSPKKPKKSQKKNPRNKKPRKSAKK